MKTLTTVEEITAAVADIDQSKWTMKGLKDILEEVADGEATLEMDEYGTVTRKVNVGFCNVYDNSRRKLMEVSQTWPNGQVLERNCCVAGKFITGENESEGMRRELSEELGINVCEISIDYVRTEVVEMDSIYYPGLQTIRTTHWFMWDMPRDLIKDQYMEDDGKKITVFEWVDDEVNQLAEDRVRVISNYEAQVAYIEECRVRHQANIAELEQQLKDDARNFDLLFNALK